MGTIDDQIADVRRRIGACGVSYRALARLAELGSDTTVRKFLRENSNPTRETTRRLQVALDKLEAGHALSPSLRIAGAERNVHSSRTRKRKSTAEAA